MQMEEEAEEEAAMQAERRQSGWVQKPIISGVEEEEHSREERITHGGEVKDQEHVPDEDINTPAESHQAIQSTEDVDTGMDRQQEAQEAARKEATREQATN